MGPYHAVSEKNGDFGRYLQNIFTPSSAFNAEAAEGLPLKFVTDKVSEKRR